MILHGLQVQEGDTHTHTHTHTHRVMADLCCYTAEANKTL